MAETLNYQTLLDEASRAADTAGLIRDLLHTIVTQQELIRMLSAEIAKLQAPPAPKGAN